MGDGAQGWCDDAYKVLVVVGWCVHKMRVAELVGQKKRNELPWLSFGLQWGCKRWGVRWSSGWLWWLCSPARSVPFLLLLLFSTHSPPLPSLPNPNPPYSLLTDRVTVVCGRLRACSGRERRVDLTRLAEFQTLTIFDRDFDFHRSIFYGAPKIVKIIKYILYIYKNVSTILI